MEQIVTFRGVYDKEAIYHENDMVQPIKDWGTSYYVCDVKKSKGIFPEGWITYPQWERRQRAANGFMKGEENLFVEDNTNFITNVATEVLIVKEFKNNSEGLDHMKEINDILISNLEKAYVINKAEFDELHSALASISTEEGVEWDLKYKANRRENLIICGTLHQMRIIALALDDAIRITNQNI